MCCGVSTSGGGRGQWAEEEGVSDPDGSEEGRWGEVVRTQETRKLRMTQKGTKSRNVGKNEKEAKQGVGNLTKQEGDGGKETERRVR